MSYLSGSGGKVLIGTVEYPITGWTLKLTANVSSFGDSAGAGWKRAVSGTKEASGDFSGKIPTGGTVPTPGQTGQFKLHLTDSLEYTGSGIISEVSVEVNVDTGEAISFKASFVGTGEWSGPA